MNYLRDPKVLAILIVVTFPVVMAFRYDPANMIQNIASEAAGVALGVLLTVTVVERMLERRHRDRWQAVRHQVLRAISNHISEIVTDYMLHLDSGFQYLPSVIASQFMLTAKAADEMGAALGEMRKDFHAAGVQNLFKATQWHFSRLRDVLTPMLVDFGEEPELIQLLVDIDGQRLVWRNCPVTEESDSDDVDMAFFAAMDTLDILVKLYRYMATGQIETSPNAVF